MLAQTRAIGSEVRKSKRMDLCKVRPRRLYLLAPKDWAQMGSIPMAKPERMEYPVMLAKPRAKDPPARARSPRRLRKSMEMMERE